MSHITADAAMGHGHGHHDAADLSPANTTLAQGSGRLASTILLLAGAVLLAVTAGFGFTNPSLAKQALAAYHIGAMSCLAMCLGAMFWVMAFHLTGAGWSVTVRRQFENVMKLTPAVALMVVPVLVIEYLTHGKLFSWMSNGPGGVAEGDILAGKKAAFLNPTFFFIRAAIYFVIWTYLARRLWWYSTEQDRTGDKWLSNRARFTSSWGMPLFALSTAFAAFDWLMSMDYRFFSTMWGVYFFAGAVFSSVPLVVLILARLRAAGKLRGLVTEEHLHDLGKLMFGFTVFWAYIAFGQYFLIWYANIPEETAFYLARKSHGWENFTVFLVVGHFILPFYILLWRFMRRGMGVLAIMAVWAIFMQVIDITWIVRPFVYAGPEFADKVQVGKVWLDAAGIIGVLGVFLGLVIRQVVSGPLIPGRDPRLPEALHHRNYV